MLRPFTTSLFCGLLLLFFAGSGYPAKNKKGFTLKFEHRVGQALLKLDSVTYYNQRGQAFQISKFKYYLSNFKFYTSTGKIITDASCYLLNEEEPSTKQITFKLPEKAYTRLEFEFGVDSLRNVNGINEGALDPINGMYWSWNSGYIFLKLEGTSPASTATAHHFEYHLGGYKTPYNCRRRIQLSLSGKESYDISVDVLSLLNSELLGGFSTTPAVSDPQHSAPLADACSRMFQLP